MRVLLDTNILIHREANKIDRTEIGVLFRWLDNLNYEKCIHPDSLDELKRHRDPEVVQTMLAKVENYNVLKTTAPEATEIAAIRKHYDTSDNDTIDTNLLNEVFGGRVDCLITEDRKIHLKANSLGIPEQVFTIDDFLEKVSAENPELADYNVLSVKKELFGSLNLDDPFFDSFKEDYDGFEGWFNRKAEKIAYVCRLEDEILAFLYLKREYEDEYYGDIDPIFSPKTRLKIGTFKVTLNGYKLGERFLKIIFDNALQYNVDEIYVTIFNRRPDEARLIELFKDWGFEYHGTKTTSSGEEEVYTKNFEPICNPSEPKKSFPFLSRKSRVFIVPIRPEYHTELIPDSILKTESSQEFIENEPHRNAIQKVYISRAYFRSLRAGDIILFYRTGGYYKSVITTIGVVESVIHRITDEDHFVSLCRKRSVFTDSELRKRWNATGRSRPFIVNFLYVYSFPQRLTMKDLIHLGVIKDIKSAPRGFERISSSRFETILKESRANANFIVD